MESIIKHLAKISGNRDHDLLNISLASSLREIVDAKSARVFELIANDTGTFLSPKVDITATTVDVIAIAEKIALAGDANGILQLQAAIVGRQPVVECCTDTGPMVYTLLWNEERLEAVIALFNPAKQNANITEFMNGILIVYKNFQALLDYNERDSLTGLFNRKTFDDSYTKLLRMNPAPVLAEVASPVAVETEVQFQPVKCHWLAVVDIDHFKRVNDQFGHLYGDEVLILIANLMRNSFESDDYLFRFGGEEFLILLHATSLGAAHRVFDTFRKRVEQYHFPQVGQITVSIGFARIDTFEPAVAIVGRADQALYYAKTHGRNQTCHYDNLVSNGDLHQEYSNDIAEFF